MASELVDMDPSGKTISLQSDAGKRWEAQACLWCLILCDCCHVNCGGSLLGPGGSTWSGGLQRIQPVSQRPKRLLSCLHV